MTQEAIALRTSGGAYPGLEVVQDVNKALDTIATDFAGASDPAALAGPYMTWADTGNMLLKRRNEANTAWVTLGPLLDYMFGRGNILDTVSQTGGVPTGGIISRLTTATGTRTRYADGTEIQSIIQSFANPTLVLTGGIYATAITGFPFVSEWLVPNPSVEVTILRESNWCSASLASVSAASYAVWFGSTANLGGAGIVYHVTATGRWYA